MERLSHDDCMMLMAAACALRSTCRRRFVGAVITDKEQCVIGTGYNGVPRATLHCIDHPCPGALAESGKDLDMCMAIHAEQNAIAHCANLSAAHTIYTTTQPCMSCMKALVATNISEIIFADEYPHSSSIDFWLSTGRSIRQHVADTPFYNILRLDAAIRVTELNESKTYLHRHGNKGPEPH